MDIKSNILFRVAIYLRLSKEDGNFSSNGKFESNSINSQREIIMNYLKKHPEMEIYDEYKDDGKCSMWTYAHERKVMEKLSVLGRDLVFQGEFCGEGILGKM